MKLVFFGTAEIARPCLRALVAAGHEVLAVVTQPDRPRGRSGAPQPPPVKEEAMALGLAAPILQPEKLGRQTRERLNALAPDVGVVVAYGQILPRTLLEAPPPGFVNVHASLLPRWRGAAPVQRAIQAGDDEIGVAVMRIVPKLDAGPVLALRRTPLGPRETAGAALARLGALGAEALCEVLGRLGRGEPVPETPQDEALVTYAAPFAKEEGAIDWARPARAIDRHIRAVQPWPGAYGFVHRQKGGAPARLEVLSVKPDATSRPAGLEGAAPGTIVEAGPRLVICCSDGAVEVERLKPAGKRDMAAEEWLRGRPVAVGDVLRAEPAPEGGPGE